MEHLKLEDLARLVDERPTAHEQETLDRDPEFKRELEALRAQKRALGNLPAILPPPGGWRQLEEELAGSGLIRGPVPGVGVWRKWMQAAAMVVLFVGGTAFGWVVRSPSGAGDSPLNSGAATAGLTASPEASSASLDSRPVNLEEARLRVVEAEQEWLRAYRVHQQLFHAFNGRQPRSDPVARLAGIEALIAASEAAVQESPADEFFNTLNVRALWERQNTLQQISLEGWH